MKASEILHYYPINEVDEEYVNEIAESIRANGWLGAPILVSEAHGMLITGSHRLAALRDLRDDIDFDIDALGDVAESVDDVLDRWCDDNDACINDIRFDCLADVFAGTWVEQYRDEIVEW